MAKQTLTAAVLGLGKARRHVTGFDRPNIRYTVLEKHKPFDQLLRFLENRAGQAGIVYALSRKRVEEVAGKLQARGVCAAAYHAGMPTEKTAIPEPQRTPKSRNRGYWAGCGTGFR